MITIECPSGLILEARRTWKLGDRKILMDRGNIKSGRLLHLMLDAVVGQVLDPGPYSFAMPGKVDWMQVTHADITTATLLVRRATRPNFSFNTLCQFCSATMPLDIDLREVPSKSASKEGVEHIRSGEPVTKKVQQEDDLGEPLGPIITLNLRLLRGQDQIDLMKYQKQENDGGMAEVQNCKHIASMQLGDGPVWDGRQDFREIRKFYAAADWGFQDLLDQLVEELGGGMDTETEIMCRDCGGEQTQILPFSPDFFLPRDKRRSSFKIVS